MVSAAVERARTRRAISREPAGDPALLSGVAGVMSRLARQQEVRELRDLLQKIDGRLGDVCCRQRNEVLAKAETARLPG